MNIILFGAPGSGKGTQAVEMCKQMSLRKISLGDILRDEVKKQSSLGKEVEGYMKKGLLVPDAVVGKVINETINDNGFILDGYPRNVEQAQMLDSILTDKNLKIDYFVYMSVSEGVIVDRLSQRRVCPKCGAGYHLENLKPKQVGVCDNCNSELIQRADDTPETIKQRWQVFLDSSKALLDYYRQNGNFIEVDASGSIADVYADVLRKIR